VAIFISLAVDTEPIVYYV